MICSNYAQTYHSIFSKQFMSIIKINIFGRLELALGERALASGTLIFMVAPEAH